mmetsp:Transcript_60255/g.160351  ORF Transcript_60255/g.160351 Transcript_60255/m.160351 type:complete len:510 (-) Transcript_60255:526-2055(-)
MGCGCGVLARNESSPEDDAAQRMQSQRNSLSLATALLETMTRSASASKRLKIDATSNRNGWKGTWNVPISLFGTANDECCRAIASHLAPFTVRRDEVLFSEGSQGSSLFFVNSGSVAVRIRGQQIATLVPAQYFGELGLMIGEGRTATIVGLSDESELLELSKESFYEVMERFPEFADDAYKELSSTSNARLRSSDMIPLDSALPSPSASAMLPRMSASSPGKKGSGMLSFVPASADSSPGVHSPPSRPRLSTGGALTSPEPGGPRWSVNSRGSRGKASSYGSGSSRAHQDLVVPAPEAATLGDSGSDRGGPSGEDSDEVPRGSQKGKIEGRSFLGSFARSTTRKVKMSFSSSTGEVDGPRLSREDSSSSSDDAAAEDLARHVTQQNGRPGMLVSLDVDAFVATPFGSCRFPGDEGPGQLLEDHFGDGLMWRVRWLLSNCWGIYATGYESQHHLLLGTADARMGWDPEVFMAPGRMPSFFFCAPLPSLPEDRAALLDHASPRSRMLIQL